MRGISPQCMQGSFCGIIRETIAIGRILPNSSSRPIEWPILLDESTGRPRGSGGDEDAEESTGFGWPGGSSAEPGRAPFRPIRRESEVSAPGRES